MKKLALLLALCLLLASLPVAAPAEAGEGYSGGEWPSGAPGLTVEDAEPVVPEFEDGIAWEQGEIDLPAPNEGEGPHVDPAGPQLAAYEALLDIGETLDLRPTLPEGVGGGVSCASSDPAVATVSAEGVVTGVATGEAVVTVTAENGSYSECYVRVHKATTTLSFETDTLRLGVGMELPFAAMVDEGSTEKIIYSIEGASGVIRYDDGVLYGMKRGKATFVAQTESGLSARCAVRVVAAPKKVTLPWDKLELGVGQVFRLAPDVGKSASTYTYATSNKKVVAVNEDGELLGVRKGSATVTVKTYNNKSVKLSVKVLKAPGSVSVSPESAELGVGETVQLTATLPEGTAGSVTYTSGDPAVATVEAETGLVTAVGEGQTTVTATTQNGKTAAATVTVFPAPTSIEVDTGLVELAAGMSHELTVTLSPGSRSAVTFTSNKPKVAAVSPEGVITAIKKGVATITVATAVPDVRCEVSVTVTAAPRKVTLRPRKLTLNVGETTQLNPVITAGSSTIFTYETSDPAVAQVSESGMVTALARGKATLTVRTHNGKSASMKLTVADPWFPEKLTIQNAPDVMQVGATLQLAWAVSPESSVADVAWATSDEGVAYVDEAGVLHAAGYGYAVITATSVRNPDLKAEFTVTVETEDVVLAIPARTTDVDGIEANLKMIEAIHAASVKQIGELYVSGTITQADAAKRKSIVDNAFKDYAFPWKTPKLQKYWKAENSEGGAKDFKPDRVYYGLPYISGSGQNRQYNAARELKDNRFTDGGKGYYILNQDNLLNGKYCGNDCSCFVDAAIWGTGSSHSADRTTEIASSSAYRTISNPNALRTGDLICKAYAHVVMFLYYANAEKTKLMVIENGGIEPGTNTVHCIVMDLSWYTSRGYKARRLASLG